jgi:hypothetical protein
MMYVLLAKPGPVMLHCIELKGLASWHETIQFLSLITLTRVKHSCRTLSLEIYAVRDLGIQLSYD